MTSEEYTEKVLHIRESECEKERKIEERIRRTSERDKRRVPLKVDSNTFILVEDENATEEYAREWKRRAKWKK